MSAMKGGWICLLCLEAHTTTEEAERCRTRLQQAVSKMSAGEIRAAIVEGSMMADERTAAEAPAIGHVYVFDNGQTMVFDQRGRQMPEFQGPTSEAMAKLEAAGWRGEPHYGRWQPPE